MKILLVGRTLVDFEVLNLVGRKYGVEFQGIGGCVEPAKFLDSVHQLNNKTFMIVSKEFGTNWKTELYQEADSIGRLIEKTKKIVSIKTDYEKQKLFFNNGQEYLYITAEPTDTEYVFNAMAYTSPDIEQTQLKKIYKQWKVDVWNWKIIDSFENYR